jgi:hypothetical protein
MYRRTFIGAAIAGTLSGCLGATRSESTESDRTPIATATPTQESTPTRTPTPTQTPTPQAVPESPTVEMGETLVVADMTDLTVDLVAFAEQLVFNDGSDFTAEDGTRYLLAHVTAEGHDGNLLGAFPGPDSFELSTRNRTVSPETDLIDWVDFGTMTHPVSERLYIGGAAASRRLSQGIVVYTVPEDLSGPVEIEMSLPDIRGPVATWRGELGRD